MNINELIVVAVTAYSGTTDPDKNGNYPVMLQCIAGTMPNRNVLSGTVAERAGFEIGKTYLAQVRERGFDKDFGPDFNFVKVMELSSGKDIAETCKLIGTPEILLVARPEGFEEKYTRKTAAVEGNTIKRIHEGKYVPENRRTYSHDTAPEIIKGGSWEDAADENRSVTSQEQE